jgi:hypothetical protein
LRDTRQRDDKTDRQTVDETSPAMVGRKLRSDYTYGTAKDPSVRALEGMQLLLDQALKEGVSVKQLLEFAAKLVYSQFNIKEVAIGMKDSADGLYKYVAMYGMRVDVWEAHKRLSYTKEDFFDQKKYRWLAISKQTKLFLAEDNPYQENEQNTYSRHLMLKSKRKTADDSIEGDYLDIVIQGPNDLLLGWLEISGTWDNKIPDARTIRCLEIVASTLGIALTLRREEELSKE